MRQIAPQQQPFPSFRLTGSASSLSPRLPDQNGGVAETTLYRDECHLQLEARGRRWSFDADDFYLRPVTEANRIKLAHYFGPYRISAVYSKILPRQPYVSC